MAIIIPSESIYQIQNPKVMNNLVNSIEFNLNKNNLENQRIFSSYFSIFTSNNGKYSYNINNYTSTLDQNSYKPTNSDVVFTNSGNYSSHYCYFKIQNIEYGKPTKKSNCNITISQQGTDEILDVGVSKLEYNNNLVIGTEQTPTNMYAFKEYNNLEEFESQILEYDFKGGTTLSDLGYVQCGVVFRDYDFDVLLLLKTYEQNSLGSYFRIQQNYNIEINLDLLNINDEKVTIGEGNNTLRIENNELMQTSNALNTPINNETSAIKGLYTNTLNAFINGKETATIRCSISDYYEENGEQAISIKKLNNLPMTFKIYDQVKPMTFNSNREDEPMSTNYRGVQKVFNVLGVKIIYDGAVWQDLFLQEA